MRWGYGGRPRSYDGEEGGGGELVAPRMKNGERGLGFAHRGRARDSGGGQTATVGALGQRRSASDRATAWSGRALSGWARRGGARRFRQRRQRGRNGTVETPTRGPDNSFNTLERHDVWQPCGNGALPGGPGAAHGV
jgi:hypothetical protein